MQDMWWAILWIMHSFLAWVTPMGTEPLTLPVFLPCSTSWATQHHACLQNVGYYIQNIGLLYNPAIFAVSRANMGRASYFWEVTNVIHIIQRRPKHISSHVKVITYLPDINIISRSILSFHPVFILADHHGNASQPHAQLQRGPVTDQLFWTEFNVNRQPKSAAGNQTKLSVERTTALLCISMNVSA